MPFDKRTILLLQPNILLLRDIKRIEKTRMTERKRPG
ncbi:hypothetical protein BROSI_A0231 [Candidatus Brocadia sinica JPN1]|uniref:Uncharacterized protein n=1 Tax=Candidatus Brocadia sinica JPN1 TaxID=1197129 RepID=A0ABQ0JSM4_9BACT|nr:hypothetical protein BROSI_A0231 [Candidatus Brocadia sinica JPN1]